MKSRNDVICLPNWMKTAPGKMWCPNLMKIGHGFSCSMNCFMVDKLVRLLSLNIVLLPVFSLVCLILWRICRPLHCQCKIIKYGRRENIISQWINYITHKARHSCVYLWCFIMTVHDQTKAKELTRAYAFPKAIRLSDFLNIYLICRRKSATWNKTRATISNSYGWVQHHE